MFERVEFKILIYVYVLHDIYLEIGDLSAQIDYLVITRKMVFVIECKNLIGDIEWIFLCGGAASPVWREPPIRTLRATACYLFCLFWI